MCIVFFVTSVSRFNIDLYLSCLSSTFCTSIYRFDSFCVSCLGRCILFALPHANSLLNSTLFSSLHFLWLKHEPKRAPLGILFLFSISSQLLIPLMPSPLITMNQWHLCSLQHPHSLRWWASCPHKQIPPSLATRSNLRWTKFTQLCRHLLQCPSSHPT